jgi:hypothetical protein
MNEVDGGSSEFYAARALAHVQYLVREIGPRPSTGAGERWAAQYTARVFQEAGVREVRTENFQSAPSTYRPYLLAFGAAMIGNLSFFLKPNRSTAGFAALSNLAAAHGFAREAALQDNWMRRVLPQSQSRNAIGIVPARGGVLRRVVVLGHLDSHRTPIVYSHPLWLRAFSHLVTMGFGSLALGASTHALAAWKENLTRSKGLGALNFIGALAQSLCIALLAEADTTPHSPGANDNASGAATMMALAERAAENPLQNTELWFVGSGCEEVGCYGIAALLDAHQSTLRDAFFLDFDMVGIGAPSLLTREGLLKPSTPDATLLKFAREVAFQNPELEITEHAGGAYTETGMITARGFAGLTIDSQRPPGHRAAARMGYWHQRDDVAENIEIECLRKTHEFGWKLLQQLDTETVRA